MVGGWWWAWADRAGMRARIGRRIRLSWFMTGKLVVVGSYAVLADAHIAQHALTQHPQYDFRSNSTAA